MKIEKTKNYEIFKFRSDNREEIREDDVLRLMEKISKKNLLHLNPIIVNAEMEIFNGQHRLLAAKNLGVDIYYMVDETLEDADLLAMNIIKGWTSYDYLNYWCKQGKQDYINFRDYLKKYALPVKTALTLNASNGGKGYRTFRDGTFKFNPKDLDKNIELIKETIKILRRFGVPKYFLESVKMWQALSDIFSLNEFDKDRWFKNISLLGNRVTSRATRREVVDMFWDIHEYRKRKKGDVFSDHPCQEVLC